MAPVAVFGIAPETPLTDLTDEQVQTLLTSTQRNMDPLRAAQVVAGISEPSSHLEKRMCELHTERAKRQAA